MRIRSIKPQFFRDSKILDLPPLARLLFQGLWCCADREGRMEYEPRELRREILPDESEELTTQLLSALESSGLTVRYSSGGRQYLAIPNFLKHQVPHFKEKPSACPSPARCKPRSSLVVEPPVICQESSVRSLLSGELSSVMGAVTPIPPSRSRAPVAVTGGFTNAWNAYPHYEQRSKRGAAWKLWVKADLEPLEANVRAHIEAARAGSDWTRDGGRFVPAFQAWLNGRDFTEPPLAVDRPVSILSEKGQATAEAAKRFMAQMQEELSHDA